MFEEIEKQLRKHLAKSATLQKLYDLLSNNKTLQAYLVMSNIIAIDRLGLSDHGPTHAKIVTAHALELFDLLNEAGVKSTLVQQRVGNGTTEDAKAVVLAGAYLHDIGHVVHRENHEIFGVQLAQPLLEHILVEIYSDEKKRWELLGSILQCIYSHDENCLSTEAGIVAIADALDMTKGRARIPFKRGKIDIHSISALSIESVQLAKGEKKPVRIEIEMSESAGIFQIGELLQNRIQNSGLKDFIEVYAKVKARERTILQEVHI